MTRANAVKTVRRLGRLELPDPLAVGLDVDRITQINSLLPSLRQLEATIFAVTLLSDVVELSANAAFLKSLRKESISIWNSVPSENRETRMEKA